MDCGFKRYDLILRTHIIGAFKTNDFLTRFFTQHYGVIVVSVK